MRDELETLTTLAYAAALDDGKWETFLQACSDLAGGGIRTCLTGYDLEARIDLGARQFGYDPEFERTYADYYFERDFLAGRMLAAGPGELVSYGDVWNRPGLRMTEFYDEWVRPQEDITSGGSVLLFKQERRLFAFSGSIRSRDTDRLEEPWQRIISHVTPHMRQAFEIARTLAGAEIEKQALVDVHDPASAGCLVVTRERRIVFANPRAQALLEQGDVVQRDLGQRLCFANTRWEHQFAAVFQGNGPGARRPQRISLCDRDNQPRLTCRIAPLAAGGLEYRPSGILFGDGEPSFLITLSARREAVDIVALLRARFGLTLNETQVVMHLSAGLSPREIARKRGTSVSTVRNQIHASMSKMGARRQSEIVSMTAAMRLGDDGAAAG